MHVVDRRNHKFEEPLGDVVSFTMGEILDGMIDLHRDMNFQRFLDTMEMDGDVELVGD